MNNELNIPLPEDVHSPSPGLYIPRENNKKERGIKVFNVQNFKGLCYIATLAEFLDSPRVTPEGWRGVDLNPDHPEIHPLVDRVNSLTLTKTLEGYSLTPVLSPSRFMLFYTIVRSYPEFARRDELIKSIGGISEKDKSDRYNMYTQMHYLRDRIKEVMGDSGYKIVSQRHLGARLVVGE